LDRTSAFLSLFETKKIELNKSSPWYGRKVNVSVRTFDWDIKIKKVIKVWRDRSGKITRG